jgi:hypothetical protein
MSRLARGRGSGAIGRLSGLGKRSAADYGAPSRATANTLFIDHLLQ